MERAREKTLEKYSAVVGSQASNGNGEFIQASAHIDKSIIFFADQPIGPDFPLSLDFNLPTFFQGEEPKTIQYRFGAWAYLNPQA
jgi:hypothetical protein